MSRHLLLLLGLLLPALPLMAAKPAMEPLDTVQGLDLERYQGRWYEIARLENRFQRKCAGDVQVRYSLRPDGDIDVVNQCADSGGGLISAEGLARKEDPNGSSARLEVRFAPAWLSFLPAVWGKYYVIDLAEDYSWAVVGHPERKYFWILSRSPRLSETVVKGIEARAAEQGYALDNLVRTRHSRVPGEVSEASR